MKNLVSGNYKLINKAIFQQMTRKKHTHVDSSGQPIQPVSEAKQKHLDKKAFKKVEAKTPGQQRYIDTIKNNIISLASSPAGCGKSYIAIGMAIEFLRSGKVEKIIVSRPAVSACGTDQGYYPGDESQKLHPFLLSLIAELEHFCTEVEINKMIANKQLITVPISLLRGHNWHNAFVMIDECANLTFREIELILNRIGGNCRVCLSGDFDQSDLPPHKKGGFRAFFDILKDMDGVGICHMDRSDIVRSEIIGRIQERIDEYKGEIEISDEIKEKFIKY